MGGAIAELLRKSGCDVTLVTPASEISSYTAKTLEQHAIQKRLLELGVSLETAHNLRSVSSSTAEIECIYTGRVREIECFASVLVTMRTPLDTLWKSNPNLDRIGDVIGSINYSSCNLQWTPLCPRVGQAQQVTKYLFAEN
jgi:dimethylamine/trimethylamine dehydrogenase